jgi:protein-disulfide isomerase
VKLRIAVTVLAAILFAVPPLAFSQQPENATGTSALDAKVIQTKVEAYLRHVYAWGPSFQLSLAPPEPTSIPGLYKLNITVAQADRSDTATFYVSRDGRFLLNGSMDDLNTDPLAETRKQINLEDAPSKGPADAKVVLVEYADFECPSCKALDISLRAMLPKYPQVRLVYKDFPLVEIHPWAMTAAIAGRCAYNQSHGGFWRFHDLLFDDQELISPENVWDKLQDIASQSGLDPAALRTCMADPKAQQLVENTRQEGIRLHIANTPTVFVNGRRQVGGAAAILSQYITYDLSANPHN